MPAGHRQALREVLEARRDIRRFRPDPVPDDLLVTILSAAHAGPSVGHSQPWRFVVVRSPDTRARAALLADRARLAQARKMDADSARHLLDLDLEGIREAPLGLVVCCDRRTPAAGVLGRATFTEADMWSCACAIQNLWLAARVEGLGVGWVTLFRPEDLAGLVGAPAGVETLGWLCVGWPDERPPAPGLERRGWSERLPLDTFILEERWPESGSPVSPRSRLEMPAPAQVVAAHDSGDRILTPTGSLGVLDRYVDRLLAAGTSLEGATLVVAGADHPVTAHGVSAFDPSVTREVMEATVAGEAVGAVAARAAGMAVVVVDAGVMGGPVAGAVDLRPVFAPGDLVSADALAGADVERMVEGGRALAARLAPARGHVFAVGEIGVGNTTVAAALGAALLGADPDRLVGLGAGSDSAILAAKRRVVRAALSRVAGSGVARSGVSAAGVSGAAPTRLIASVGGGEFAVLAGFVLGAAEAGATVILDGMATGVAALAAVEAEPAVAAHLVAGQRSREPGHGPVLDGLGLEPLLDLRLRAGEGVGAVMAAGLLRAALQIRLRAARTGEAGG
jgi:nicotinate-nucleotide--dimethylbenzimidazole phosphoribosyltransferase